MDVMKKKEKLETSMEVGLTTPKKIDKKKYYRLGLIVILALLVVFAVYFALKQSGVLKKWADPQKIKSMILKGGNWSIFILFVIQFLQVTFIPLPAMVTTIAGVLVFGPWTTFWVSTIAIILASLFAFFLGRVIGDPIINWSIGKEEAKVWREKLGQGKYVFFLMMLFPIFPDDMLCMLAGVTSMTYTFFIWTQVITRPISTFIMCFLSSGYVIPFSGWGIPVWIVLLASCAVLFYLAIKYQRQIEEKILALGRKMKSRSKK